VANSVSRYGSELWIGQVFSPFSLEITLPLMSRGFVAEDFLLALIPILSPFLMLALTGVFTLSFLSLVDYGFVLPMLFHLLPTSLGSF
jgi:hypothetical protein